MNRNLYETARLLKAPAVDVVATFNPARLPTKLRNMVRKSIASGIHIGGWSSKTREVRKLVFSLLDEIPPVYVNGHSNYLHFVSNRPIDPDVRQELYGLLEADAAICKMAFTEEGRTGYYRMSRHDHNTHIDERLQMNKVRVAEIGVKDYSLVVPTKHIRDQIANLFVLQRTPEEVAIAERMARLIDKDENFIIPTSHNF